MENLDLLKQDIDIKVSKQDATSEEEEKPVKSYTALVEEMKHWYILVKVDRMPFLERLVSSTKISIQETCDGVRDIKRSLAEKLKKAVIYICTKCDIPFKFYQDRYQHNVSVHLGKTFTCEVCSRVFGAQRNLRTHKKFVHSNKRPFTCSVCNFSFKENKLLRRHLLMHLTIVPFKCKFCEKDFSRKDSFKEHLRKHVQTSEDRRFKCSECERTFFEKSTLTHHMMTHTGERPYKCDLCDRTFIQSSHYYEHLRDHDIKHTCKTCNKTFSCSSNLRNHRQKVHTDLRPFKCVTCNKALKDKGSLNSHMLLHQPKQFPCYVCKKYFRHHPTLKLHLAQHFKKVVSYKCDFCKMTFKVKKGLDKHVAQDHCVKSFKCDLCKKIFLYRTSLNRHKSRKHRNIKIIVT